MFPGTASQFNTDDNTDRQKMTDGTARKYSALSRIVCYKTYEKHTQLTQ